jgi:curved DNA-binding protein CbpA
MEQSLKQLEFKSMAEVTSESLKRAFKDAVVHTHPDRGGQEGDFDKVLAAYFYLSNVLKRLSGGRGGLQTIYVEDVIQAREDQFIQELNNLMNDVMDQMDKGADNAFQKDFNEQFEKLHVREEDRGYGEWLKDSMEDPSVEPVDPSRLNELFESTVTMGKPVPTSIILHPDEMATISGKTHGTVLIRPSGQAYTSDPDTNPEYTDLHDAYTSDNTIFDKLPVYQEKVRTFEDLLKEREMVYTSELDRDLEAIAAYEKKKMDEEKEHKQQIATYFKRTAASQWAIRGVFTKDGVSFVKQI